MLVALEEVTQYCVVCATQIDVCFALSWAAESDMLVGSGIVAVEVEADFEDPKG